MGWRCLGNGMGRLGNEDETVTDPKPYDILRKKVWQVYWNVKANRCAEGVDGESRGMFEADLAGKFYGSSRDRVGEFCSFFDRIGGSMQVRIFRRRYSSSRNPYARRCMTRILLFNPSTNPRATLFSGLQ